MTNINHRDIAHRAIDHDINNILDELHDRALDDFADMLEPHLDALRALAYARHDIACSDMTPTTLTNEYDMLDTLADAPCMTASTDAISLLAYSYYRD